MSGGEGISRARLRRSRAAAPLVLSHALNNKKKRSTASSPSVEYKLLTVGDDGEPITWQAGPNRVLELSGGAAEVKVADSLEAAGGPTVEAVVVVGAPAAAAPAPAPAAAPAPPATTTAPPAPASPPSSAVVAAASASAATPSAPLSSLTVKELKARLAAAGLATTGKKADLVSRLEKKHKGV